MKKLFAVLLTLCMLLGLTACGVQPVETTIVGTWKGPFDIGELVTAQTDVEFDEPVYVDMVLSFHEDGTYSASVDKESAMAAIRQIAEIALNLIIEEFVGEGKDLEQLLAEEGLTMEEAIQEMMTAMDLDRSLEEAETIGYYKLEEGKLYFAEDKEDLETVQDSFLHVTLKGKTLTITEIEVMGEKASEEMPALFPWVFTKK